jgi:hypothetical protein
VVVHGVWCFQWLSTGIECCSGGFRTLGAEVAELSTGHCQWTFGSAVNRERLN